MVFPIQAEDPQELVRKLNVVRDALTGLDDDIMNLNQRKFQFEWEVASSSEGVCFNSVANPDTGSMFPTLKPVA